MRLRIMSDLHLEFENYIIPELLDDKNTILILAGDIITGNHFNYEFFEKINNQFKAVIYIFGNHEYYQANLGYLGFIKNKLRGLTNIYLLEDEVVSLEGFNFLASTLWTNILDRTPSEIYYIHKFMNDFKCIENFNLRTQHEINRQSFLFLLDNLSRLENQKNIVITHHTPSYQSIHPKHNKSPLNGAFSNHLENLISVYNPLLWIHGHTHDSFDYNLYNTRIICNPKGYIDENKSFNPYLNIVL